MSNNFLSRVISALQQLQREQADANFFEIVNTISKVSLDGRICFEDKKKLVQMLMSMDREGLTPKEKDILDSWTE